MSELVSESMSQRKPQVWFLTGSQHLYGAETLAQVADQSQQIQRALTGTGRLSAEIVGKPVLTGAADIRRVMQEANTDPDCLGVIAWMHTFSPAKMWITGLDALRKPLLHLHTQLNEALPWASIDMDFMNLNQAAHGDREFGHVQTRLGVARKTVAGHASDPVLVERIDGWIRAAAGRNHLDGLRLARFGDNMRDVAVTEGDKVEAELRFGVSVNTYGVNDLVARVDAVPDAAVDALVATYADSYRLAPELARGGARHASLRYAARIEAGLREFLVDGGFGAFTDLALAAHVEEPTSGRAVTVFTDQPGVQFYSGNFLDGTTALRDGSRVRQGDAFCLEPQQFPNAPNEPGFPSTVFRPGECYRSRIVLRFARNCDG